MFDEIIAFLMGTPPETIDNVYIFIIYLIEVSIRLGLFGFVLRFVSNLFTSLGGSRLRLFS